MAGFGLFTTFGLMVLCLSHGQITSPLNGKSFIFLNGETANITWSFKDDISKVGYRAWYFTSSNGVFSGHKLGGIIDDDPPTKTTSLFDVEIKKPGTLLLKNVNLTYDGTYRFDLIAPVGGRSTVVVFIAKKPNVTVNCSSLVTLNEGENFTCLCRGEGGNPPANVTWFKDGDKFSDVKTENQTLTLLNVGKANIGTYTCVATSYKSYTDEKKIQIIVILKPFVTLNCSSIVTLNAGDNFVCLCKGDRGNPPANVTWYKDGVKISDVGTERQKINLLNVGTKDRGTYKCVASSNPDEKYTDEKFIQVIIFFKPTNTVIRFSANPAAIIGSITVTCTSDGFPEPITTIYHNGTKIVSDSKRYSKSQVKWKDTGVYKCIAINAIGEYSDYEYLNVMEKTKPTTATSRSLSSTSVTNREGNETEKADPGASTDVAVKWYIVVVILLSGMIIGILISYIFICSRRKFRKAKQSNSEPPTSPVDLTYQELDLKTMNKGDNYQSLTVNAVRNDGVNNDESNYTDLTKTRDVENNHQSLT
ncbi:hemicentin-1-like [Dendronephthya gigantea]|uniref:hemicentin-1-like n=1 Tax=Dendronephthya gigantea TaxID=151771 RepID=UPI00106D4C95|nr:hemicentin-1-like [Dendronephthya gigantea]